MLFLVYIIGYHYRLNKRKKYILILGDRPTDGLDETQKENCISLHYNAANSFLYANCVNNQQLKPKDSEIKLYPLCLKNVWKDLTDDKMKKKSLLKGTVYDFIC